MLVDYDYENDILYLVSPTDSLIDLALSGKEEDIKERRIGDNAIIFLHDGKPVGFQLGKIESIRSEWIISNIREQTPEIFVDPIDRWFDLISVSESLFNETSIS